MFIADGIVRDTDDLCTNQAVFCNVEGADFGLSEKADALIERALNRSDTNGTYLSVIQCRRASVQDVGRRYAFPTYARGDLNRRSDKPSSGAIRQTEVFGARNITASSSTNVSRRTLNNNSM